MRKRERDQMVAIQLRDIAMRLDDWPGRRELLAMADRLDPPGLRMTVGANRVEKSGSRVSWSPVIDD